MSLQDDIKRELGDAAIITAAGGDDEIDGVMPQLVAAPKSAEAAQTLVAWCGKNDVAVVPRGGGSKILWGAPPTRCEVIFSSRHLTEITDHDPGNSTVKAQSGIALAELDKQVKKEGQFVPLDYADHAGATLGGVMATNHFGATAKRYRFPRDMIVGFSAILSNGDIVENRAKVVKNVSGYDLGKLFTGSFGTLGFITSVTTRLRPVEGKTAWWHGTCKTWQDAQQVAQELLTDKFEPAVLRVIAHKSTFAVMARFDGVAESVDAQLARLPASSKLPQQFSDNIDLALQLRAVLPLALAADFAQTALDKDAALVQWDAALGAVAVQWNSAQSPKELIEELRQQAQSAGGILIVQKAPSAIKTPDLVWGAPRGDFALHQDLKSRFDAKGIFSPGRFIGGL